MQFALLKSQPSSTRLPTSPGSQRRLTETDAIDLWIARWLRIRRKDLIERYGVDPRRIYEIWEGAKFPAARRKALERFERDYPNLRDRVDFGPHRRIPRGPDPELQLALFDDFPPASAR
jgi:hypothetical protein